MVSDIYFPIFGHLEWDVGRHKVFLCCSIPRLTKGIFGVFLLNLILGLFFSTRAWVIKASWGQYMPFLNKRRKREQGNQPGESFRIFIIMSNDKEGVMGREVYGF